MKRMSRIIAALLFVAAFQSAPLRAQEATATPLEPPMATDVPPIVVETPDSDVPVAVFDSFISILTTAAGAVVALVLAVVGGLVWMARVNAKAVADNVPKELVLRVLDIGAIAANITTNPKDNAEIEKARQELIEAYQNAAATVRAQAAIPASMSGNTYSPSYTSDAAYANDAVFRDVLKAYPPRIDYGGDETATPPRAPLGRTDAETGG